MATLTEPVCTSCGDPVAPEARFCPSCGVPRDVERKAAEQELRKTVTLLFCDVAGSTALGEALDPEVLRAVMGRYFDVAAACIDRHGGKVEKFVGDAVLAVFGIPQVREDDALRAVRAAADLQAELAVLADELLVQPGVRLSVRTGVNTGSVVAGAARAGGSFATGDAVNTAARLEQAAAAGDVLLGASTYALVRDAVDVEAVPALTAKGKAEPLPAYRLLRVHAVERGRRRRLGAPLVGRERECAALQDALARAVEVGRGQLVTVLGAAGMGKTRLVEHFVGELDEDVRVLRGRCLSYGRGITFWPIVQVLRGAAGLTGEESVPEAERALLDLLDGAPDGAAATARLLPLLGLGGEPGGSDETFWAVRTLLEHLAAQAPLVVTVDDVHWAEPTLLDLLERVRDEARDVPLLMVCQARPELLDIRPGWGGGALNATTFLLEPFGPSQTAALLHDQLGGDVSPDAAAAIEAWADGNPLFVEELAVHLIEEGRLERTADGWELNGPAGHVSVPPTVSALLSARLDRLPPDERALLETLSVIGLEVTGSEAVALSSAGHEVPVLLEGLARRDLLRRARGARRDVWAFRHVLLREAAYDSLPKAVRATLHERYADLLGASVGSAEDSASGVAGLEVHAFVGYHLEQAVRWRQELGDAAEGLAERAAGMLADAAEAAEEVDDVAAAAGLLDRAVAVSPRPDGLRRELLFRLTALRIHTGDVLSGRATAAALLELCDAAVPAVERCMAEAFDLHLRADAGDAYDPQLLADAAGWAAEHARRAGDDRRLVEALKCVISAAAMVGRWQAAEAAVQEALTTSGAKDRRTMAVWQLAAYSWGPRPIDDALRAVAVARAVPGASARSVVLMDSHEAAMLAMSGQAGRARAMGLPAERAALDFDTFTIAAGAFFFVQMHVALGDLAAAVRALDAGIEACRSSGSLSHGSTLLAWKGLLLLELHAPAEEATQALDAAQDITSPFDAMSVSMVSAGRAVLAARHGNRQAALALLGRALEVLDGTDQDLQRADQRRWLAEVPRLAGDETRRRELLEQALALYERKGHLPLADLVRRELTD
ncbi:MAG: adenylate/guanylate cyclase [Frankiales bacterium]|nr:adenylate/guanylate cyclase [Frankiales bacterium]